ncbi:MAG: VWA domain-containing protein [Burkholderiaceae bacterium]|nr:VWA domain-containing protein [Burkholderiaceae bacterium]
MRRHSYRSHPARQRGQVLIIVGLSLVVLIGAVGLAIDSGRAYGVKARLNAAVDAAAIAAARALSEGADDNQRRQNAQAAAARFFQMNYPNGFLGSTPSAPSTSAVHEASGYWRVNVSATADMPTTFMRVLGNTEANVAAAGEAIRRDLDVILVMDTSGSLGPPTSPSSVFPTLKSAAKSSFINRFAAGANGDRVGLVSFSSGSVIDVQIDKTGARGFNRTAINNAIDALPLGGATASAEGMRKALEELNAVPAAVRSSLRVILFFSDGAPNIINGTFPRQSGGTVTGNLYSETSSQTIEDGRGRSLCRDSDGACRLFPQNQRNGNESWYSTGNSSDVDGPRITSLPLTGSGSVALSSYNNRRTINGSPYTNNRCNVNKAARNMVENIANTARGQDVRIYTIGLGDALNNLEVTFCGYGNNERGATILRRLANTADSDTLNAAQPQGLYCHAATAVELDRCFSTIASEILRLTL